MSKIGRKPINIEGVSITVDGNEVHYKGKNASGVHVLPPYLTVTVEGGNLLLTLPESMHRNKKFWGLHRVLLANKIHGARADFERKLKINGLGFKAQVAGRNVTFSLGFSHKINFELPTDVAMETDKTGQLVTLKSYDRELLGQVAQYIRSLRPPEPYKGTGIQYSDEVIIRKAGKKKSA